MDLYIMINKDVIIQIFVKVKHLIVIMEGDIGSI